MAGSYNAGSVNAKITLDDSEFLKEIEALKKKTQELANQVQTSSQNTSNAIDNLVGLTNELRAGQDALYGSSSSASKSIEKEAKNMKKLSEETLNNVNNVNKVTDANKKLERTLDQATKRAKSLTSELDQAFTKDLRKAIGEAEKLLGGKAVGLKPIFDNLAEKYAFEMGGMEEFADKFYQATGAMGAYYKSIDRFAKNIKMVDVGKNIPFNLIDVQQLVSMEQLDSILKGVAEGESKVAEATEKSTEANQKNIDSAKKRIAINKQLATSLGTTDPAKQAQFNKELYNYLSALADPDLGLGKSGVTLKRIKKEFADFTDDAKELEALITNAVHEINAPMKNVMGEGRATFWIKDLKEPIAEVTKELDKLATAEKEVEAQTKRVSLSLQQFFTKTLHEKLWQEGAKGSKGVFADAYKNQMRYVFGDMTPTEFDKRFAQALKDMGIKSKGTGSMEVLDFGGYFKPTIENVKELKEGLDEVTESTEKEVETVKQVTASMDKTNQSAVKTLDLLKQINLTKEQQLHLEKEIQKTMASETYDYIANLKRGRNSKGVLGTDSALWKRYNGGHGRVKTFDMDKYLNHMRQVFEEMIPTDLFDKVFTNFLSRFKIGQVPPFKGQGGIKENYWEQLLPYKDLHSLDELEEEIRSVTSAVESLGTAEAETDAKTKELTNSTEAYKAQILSLGNLIKGHLFPSMNRFSQKSDEIINNMTRMARANELYDNSAQKVAESMGYIVSNINLLKEFGYNFGFKGLDAQDAHFINSTLRAVESLRIMPKNPLIRLFDEDDKEFLKHRYGSFIQALRDGTNYPIDRKTFGIPTRSEMAKDPHWELPFTDDYTDILEPENYEKAIKNVHTRIRRLLDWLNITLVKETKGNMRLWNEELGKYELFGSLDVSNMNVLGSIKEFRAEMDKAIDKLKLLEHEESLTVMRTKELSYALRDVVNAGEILGKEQEKALIRAKRLANAQTIGVDYTWGTAEEFRDALIGFRNLIEMVDKFTTSENKATTATKELGEAQGALVTQIKYTFQELALAYDMLPVQVQKAMDNIRLAIKKKQDSLYDKKPRKKMYEDIQKELEHIPFLNVEQLLTDVSTQKSRNLSGIKNLTIGDDFSTGIDNLKDKIYTVDNEIIKLTASTTELGNTALDLTGKTKYSLGQLIMHIRELPKEMQTALRLIQGMEIEYGLGYGKYKGDYPYEIINKLVDSIPILDEKSVSKLHQALTNSSKGFDALRALNHFRGYKRGDIHDKWNKEYADKLTYIGELDPYKSRAKYLYPEGKNVNEFNEKKFLKDLLREVNNIKTVVNTATGEVVDLLPKSQSKLTDFFDMSTGKIIKNLELTSNKVKQLGEAEDTVTKSTDNFTNSLKKAVAQANNLKKGVGSSLASFIKEFEEMYMTPSSKNKKGLDELYKANLLKYYNKISDDEWLKEVQKWGKQVENLNIGKFIGAYGTIGKVSNEKSPFRFLTSWGDTEKILKEVKDSEEKVTAETTKLGDSAEKSAEQVNKLASALKLIRTTRKGISSDNLSLGTLTKDEGLVRLPLIIKNASASLDDFTKSEEKLVTETKQVTKSVDELGESLVRNRPKLIFLSNLYGGTPNNAIESMIESVDARLEEASNTALKVLGVGRKVTDEAKNATVTLDSFTNSTKKSVEAEKQLETETANVSNRLKELETIAKGVMINTTPIGTSEFLKEYVEYRRFTQELLNSGTQQFGISIYQQFKNVIPAIVKAREEILKLGEAYDFLVRAVSSSNKRNNTPFNLNAYIGAIKNIEPHIKDFENRATKAFENIRKESSRLPVVIKKVSDSYDKAGESEKRFERQTESSTNSIKKNWQNIFQQLNKVDEKIRTLYGRKIDSRNLYSWNLYGDASVEMENHLANSTNALKTFDNTVIQTARDVYDKLITSMKAFYEMNKNSEQPVPIPLDQWKSALGEIKAFELRYTALMNRMYNLSRGLGKWINEGKVNTGYGKLLEDMGLLNTEGSLGRLNVVGYSDYVARIHEIQEALTSANATSNTYKESLRLLAEAIKLTGTETNRFASETEKAILAMTKMAETNESFGKLGTDINNLVAQIEHFGAVSTNHQNGLKGINEQALILKDRLNVVENEFKEGRLSEEAYNKEINKITESFKKLQSTATQTIRELNLVQPTKFEGITHEINKGKQSLNEFGKTMNAQEKYVDNLYRGLQKARSVIISMKTILRMMGGMAVWNFGFELLESAKETYVAKNEMESLLNQNAKVDASGIQYFNKQLDETAEKFQKINKYSLGETATSIGLEFDLSAKEMAKSLDIIAMIQSEYVRAGRTTEEAGLAVKDILQGEFMRLSRETGVGKEELIEAGWSGDNKDVLSLMSALEKVGKARHWDEFAKKATSLNDVLTITKSRFSELGAEIGTVAEPLIVGAFNSILGAVETLKNGFEGLGSFGKNFALLIGGTAGIGAVATGYLMLAKNMGVLEIATHGVTKSLAMNALQLNRNDVALHGFWKTLLASVSGTEASTVANIGFKKSLVARVLGVNQTVVAEQGLKHAMVENIFRLKESEDAYKKVNNITGKHINLEKASILSKDKSGIVTSRLANIELTRSQKLAYLTTNLKYAEVAELSRGKALLKTATSWKVLGTAIKGVTAIGIASWFASVATWADTVSKRIEKYNTLLQEGKEKVKDAQKTYDKWNSKLEQMDKNDPQYNLTKRNADTANATLGDLKLANALAKDIKKNSKEVAESHDLMLKGGLNNIYNENGLNVLKEGGKEYQQMKYVAYDLQKAEQERYNFEYASLQHITEHTQQMKEAGISEEKRLRYITEYSAKASEVAENLKKFNQGDLTAGLYYALGRLQLMWIDLWNDKDFINFWESVKKTFKDLEPTLIAIGNALGDLGREALKFFSTDQGKIVGGALIIGGAIAGIAYKIAPTLKKLKEFGGTLKDVLGKIKDWKKETGSDTSSDKKTDDTSTGGIAGDIEKGSGSLGTDLKNIGKNRLKSFANNALLIAEGMALMTEAIYMIQAPMWALAETGKTFKAKETSIRAGIEGLQLIAPTVIAILVPIMALMKVMDMWGSQIMNIKTIGATALGIALGIGLVTEAIIMLKAPMWALSEIGKDFSTNKMNMENAIDAINTMAESLKALAPFVPVFLAGIALMAVAFAQPEIGILAIGATVIGIALGMAILAEAVVTLRMPLEAIAQLGNSFTDIEGAKQGAEALKVTAEAMGYVEEAMRAMMLVKWEEIGYWIGELITKTFDIKLTDLTKEGGFFTQLNEFMNAFNSLDLVPPEQGKVDSLNSIATGMGAVSSALKNVKDAMANLPPEFKNSGGGQPLLSYDSETDKTSVTGSAQGEEGSGGYFEQLKAPLRELKKFIDDFNKSEEFNFEPPEQSRIDAINQSAEMVTQINEAVQNVKTAMQGIGDSQWDTAYAEGGILSAVGNFLYHSSGDGAINNGSSAEGYVSSLGSSLKEMENVVKDITTFNNNINTLVSGGNGDGNGDSGGTVNAMANMVTAVDQAIQNLSTTLSNAVPTIKENAKSIGTGIRNGVKEGIGDLTTIVNQPLIQALNNAKAQGHTYGTGVGYQTTEGFKTGLKIKSATESEIGGTLEYLESKKQDFYDKGKALGESASQGYKDGNKMHSPGIIATSTFQEMAYVEQAFDDAIAVIPAKAQALGASLAESYSPQIATDVGLTDMTAFESGLAQIGIVATDTDMVTTTAFNNMNLTASDSMTGMTTSINGAFTNINVNATQSYAKLTNTTRTSLKNMQDQTTKNINAIKTSWRGMQTALIASAENIRSETSSKIHQLESNMASFWNKVNNPALLLGGGGTVSPSMVRRSRGNTLIMPGTGTRARLGAGGGKHTIQKRRAMGGTDSNMYSLNVKGDFQEYLKCLMNGGSCIAGGSGWHFDWTEDIRQAFLKWDTHFGDTYDPYLKVGKFENDDFPVRGIAEVAKKYIFEQISKTSYEKYFDSKYDSPLEAWNAGHFNCVDGALVAIAFANAFGFPGGYVAYSSWNGIGHGFAVIPGLGIIDATAIQNRGAFTAPDAVSYPSAGNVKHTMNRNTPRMPNMDTGNTIQGNVVFNIEIKGDVEDAEEKGKEVGRKASEVFISMFKRSDATGM